MSGRGTVHDPALKRRDRLHRKAGQLFNDKIVRLDRYGNERVCFRWRIPMCNRGTDGGPVVLRRSPDRNNAQYFGIQTCGSSWVCPECAPKIAAEHVKQINLAIYRALNGWRGWSGAVYLLTFTNCHDAERAGQGQCKAEGDRLAEALSYFKGSRPFKRFKEASDFHGLIRALETTYGELNGWHHHTHEILFSAGGQLVLDRKFEPVRWLSPLWKLRKEWARVLIKFGLAGLKPGDTGAERFQRLRHLLRYCFDARSGAHAAEYVAKLNHEPEKEQGGRWGLASELAKSHLKRGHADTDGSPQRCRHASPWALLNDALDGDKRSGELFKEFGEAFHGRAKIYWSSGMKAFFDIADLADEDVAARPDERCTEHVIELLPSQWGLILAFDMRYEVKRLACAEGRDAVVRLLDDLAERSPTHSGEFTQTNSFFVPMRREAA